MLSPTKLGRTGLLIFASLAISLGSGERATAKEFLSPSEQSPPAPGSTGPMKPTVPPGISYSGGILTINAPDATLVDVLMQVASLTGMKIDFPNSTNSERVPSMEFGPGPARQVVAILLSDSNFDFVIQGTDTDTENIQNLILMPRQKRSRSGNGIDSVARNSRSPFAKSEPPPEPPIQDTALPPLQPENGAVAPNSPNAIPDAAKSLQTVPVQPALQEQPNSTRPGALSPPQTMDSQSINQQLQQMYQQRMQMMQQERQSSAPSSPANPENK